MYNKKIIFGSIAAIAIIASGACVGFLYWQKTHTPIATQDQRESATVPTLSDLPLVDAGSTSTVAFGSSVVYEAPSTKVNPDLAKDFQISEIQNLAAIQKAYGIAFNESDLDMLQRDKFVVKRITDTSIKPSSSGDTAREFFNLYSQLEGSRDYKERKPENSIFFSSDVFFNAYNNIYTELLKEMENKEFYPAMTHFSETFYLEAQKKLDAAKTDAEKTKWTKVRNYFVVPYAIFSSAAKPLSQEDYYSNDGGMVDPQKVMDEFAAKDSKVDTYDTTSEFVKKLSLDARSESDVLSDLKKIFEAGKSGVPSIFQEEYAAYTQDTQIAFAVDFTQFTPRGTYNSSSLRREYFRGMKWYIMLPFFLKSPELTTYAYAITQLIAERPDALKAYNRLESTIGFLVGTSDDLMPVDYLQALTSAKDAQDPSAVAMDYLVKARNPKIKDLKADYPEVGKENTEDVKLLTKGMRLFSGKFILDSYWTGMLTQGDEAPRPGYSQKLPPMASSLEVMGLLGSDYAKSKIPTLSFYKETNSKAIDQMMAQLKAEEETMTETDWTSNIYFAWLWTIKSLFSWQADHHQFLPQFMQSPKWDVKTLMTASAFWTELRHATILYAKQSFAEMGAGGDDVCDRRTVPLPPKGYIEPQSEAYARLSYLAKRTDTGLKEMNFQLNNLNALERFIELMDTVQSYTKKELENQTLKEEVVSSTRQDPQDETKTCIEYSISGDSDWENIRLKLIDGLSSALPYPTEGPILSAKDKRAALVADVHTGGDSGNPTSILYEGEGIPYVILTAVKDANGPRLTVGFTYSHYEFVQGYGGKRLTDEEWQQRFYEGNNTSDAYTYTDPSKWPQLNTWYLPLFGSK